MNMKSIRYIILLAIIGLSMYGIVTVNLAFQPFVYLLAVLYIATLIIQSVKEKKTSLTWFFSIVGVIAIILFVLEML